MSWITETAALYDEIKEKVNDSDEWEPILPLYHSTSNAQIQVTIFSDGTFSHAEVVDADAVSYTHLTLPTNSLV
mgnify:CR=1 FL=1